MENFTAVQALAIGEIKSTKGEVFAKSADGQMRRLATGDKIFEGEVIITASGSSAEISMFNGATFNVAEQQSVAVDSQGIAPAQEAAAGAVPDLGATEAATVIQAAKPGEPQDFNVLLAEQAAAAGLAGGDGGGGSSFVDLARINETVPTTGFGFPTNPAGTAPTIEGQGGVPSSITATVSLAASTSVTEGGFITYTATLSNPADANNPVTVILNNGATITIPGGASSGSISVPAPSEDVYVDAGQVSTTISSASGGNFGSLTFDPTAATTSITDTIDMTTVSLTASTSVAEGGFITYTASLNNPADANSPVTVTLNNGATITIPGGASSGSISVPAPSDDVYVDAGQVAAKISSASGGNFENLLINANAATTSITDTINTTTVSLTASTSVAEGGFITYTASLNNPADTNSPVTVTLNNGATITIAGGTSSGSVSVPAPTDDVYVDAGQVAATIRSASGGNFENLAINPNPAATSITDTIDTTTVSLTATPSITEAGTSITYTATLNNPAGAGSPVTVTLSNGETITIAGGGSSGSVVHAVTPDEDVYIDPTTVSATISSATGGNFENLAINPNAAATSITDTTNTVTATLTTSTSSIDETGGSITYTITLASADGLPVNPKGDLTFTLANGEVITISPSQTSNSVTKVYADADIESQPNISNHIASVAGGAGYENLVPTGVTSVDVNYGVTINGIGSSGGDVTVHESNLPAGSSPDSEALKQVGHFDVTARDGLGSVIVGSTTLSLSDLQNLTPDSPVIIDTPYGALKLTGYEGGVTGGTINYTYTLDTTVTNDAQSGATGGGYVEKVDVTVYDADGNSATSPVNINIVDDTPTLTATGLAIANLAGEYAGTYSFNVGADVQPFSLSFGEDSLVWKNPAGDYTLVYDHENSTATKDVYNAVNADHSNTFFSVAVNSDGTYNFDLETPAPVTTSDPINVLSGVEGGSGLPSYPIESSMFGGYFSLLLTGTSTAHPGGDTLTISATELGVGDNVMQGNKGDVLKFDVVPEPEMSATLHDLTIHLASTGGVKTTDSVDMTIHYTEGTDPAPVSQVIGSDYSVTYTFDPARTVDYVTLAPHGSSASFKISGVELSYDHPVFPDDYKLDFTLTGSDADHDTVPADFSVAVNTSSTGSYTISGTEGNDLVYGTAGADTFVWKFPDTTSGTTTDKVTDFGTGDKLDLSDLVSNGAHIVVPDTTASTITVTAATPDAHVFQEIQIVFADSNSHHLHYENGIVTIG